MTTRPSIITFSRRTDPAFRMEWFMEALARGECMVPNPYSGKEYRVGLKPEEVSLLIFWTRAPAAIAPYIPSMIDRGYRSAFFITLTGYPQWLEPAVPDRNRVWEGITALHEILGEDSLWWRYDPIILTGRLTASWHIENFTRLCGTAWRGRTGRVIVSLAHIDGPYASLRGKLARTCVMAGDRLAMPTYDAFIKLALELAVIAGRHGMELEVCCSPSIRPEHRSLLRQGGCLAGPFVEKLAPSLAGLKQKGTRRGSEEHGYAPCGCLESRDIGTRRTCRHGCVYCYANR